MDCGGSTHQARALENQIRVTPLPHPVLLLPHARAPSLDRSGSVAESQGGDGRDGGGEFVAGKHLSYGEVGVSLI